MALEGMRSWLTGTGLAAGVAEAAEFTSGRKGRAAEGSFGSSGVSPSSTVAGGRPERCLPCECRFEVRRNARRTRIVDFILLPRRRAWIGAAHRSVLEAREFKEWATIFSELPLRTLQGERRRKLQICLGSCE